MIFFRPPHACASIPFQVRSKISLTTVAYSSRGTEWACRNIVVIKTSYPCLLVSVDGPLIDIKPNYSHKLSRSCCWTKDLGRQQFFEPLQGADKKKIDELHSPLWIYPSIPVAV